jgi:hypothetical protein
VRRLISVSIGLLALMALFATLGTAATDRGKLVNPRKAVTPESQLGGHFAYGDQDYGTTITECPQAGLAGKDREHPLDRRKKDRVEQLSEGGDDVRANTDYSCFPQNETSIAINPRVRRNVLSSQNDYRTLSRQGFNASTDNANSFYSAELVPLSVPNADILDASGDPVSVFDRAGIGYEASINFNRTDDENGITVQRSTNGGFTWSRPCVPVDSTPTNTADDLGTCHPIPAIDPRQPGDGIVTYFDDPDAKLCGEPGTTTCPPFDDKEWLAAGPRPFTASTTDPPSTRIAPVCFSAFTRTPGTCDPDVVGVDRLYVTWTRFEDDPAAQFRFTAQILLSYSDDQGRSWSPPRIISGNAPFCLNAPFAGRCDLNQFSVPTVHPHTGLLGVAFENFNTPGENQYLFVRSTDGGTTFTGPFFITPVFDINYPLSGLDREDCAMRGQQDFRAVLTNSCFRVNSGGNPAVDKRGGAFADDFYLVMSDNRNGTFGSSNTDVFFFKSTDGGMTWIGPTRVNNDRSDLGGANRDSGTPGNFGNDQWFPWMDISAGGTIAVGFHDRRLDTNSTRGEWPMSRAAPNGRPGNYLAWFFGAGCEIDSTATVTATSTSIPSGARDCLAPGAAIQPQPTAPVDPPAGPVPGQGPAFLGPFANAVISDVPHNLDYSFRAGIFMGDYNAVAYVNVPGGSGSGHHGEDDDDDDGGGDGKALAFWTDSRNGRGSGNPTNPETNQPGRNPACEQADVFVDWFNPLSRHSSSSAARNQDAFLVTPCPADATHETDDHDDD